MQSAKPEEAAPSSQAPPDIAGYGPPGNTRDSEEGREEQGGVQG